MRRSKMAAVLCAAMLITAAVPFTAVPEAAVTAYAEETVTEGDLMYTVNEDGTLTLTKFLGDIYTVGMIVVPETVDGKTVTAVGPSIVSGGFDRDTGVRLILPDTVTWISEDVRKGYGGWLTLCTKVGSAAAAAAEALGLNVQYIDESGTYIYDESDENDGTVVLLGLVDDTTSIVLPSEIGGKPVSEIGYGVLSSVTDVTIPEGTTALPGGMFLGYKNIKTITLPASLTSIGDLALITEGDTLIRVVEGSYAHEYCAMYHYSFEVIGAETTNAPGDVNGDGEIDASDASDLLVASTEKAVGHETGLTTSQELAADVDGDGSFDAADASCILIYSTLRGTGRDVSLVEVVTGKF